MATVVPRGSASIPLRTGSAGPALYPYSPGRKPARLTEATEKEAPDRVSAGADRARALGCSACSTISHEKGPRNGQPWGLPHCSEGASEGGAGERTSVHARGLTQSWLRGTAGQAHQAWGGQGAPSSCSAAPQTGSQGGALEWETAQAKALELTSVPPPRLACFSWTDHLIQWGGFFAGNLTFH